jgi:4-aminobutyrate aminotransferase
VPTPGFFPALRKLCDRYGILLIADEVQSGMGRTGKWWGIQHFGVEPDILCIAKGIASGMPMGIMAARQEIMDWPRSAHGNTYGGNPISCAAALATIDLIENGLMQNTNEVGEYALEKLRQMMARHPSIGEVRGMGLMIGVEFVKSQATREPNEKLRDQIVDDAFQHGLLLLGCGKSTIRITPPLSVTREEVAEALEIFEAVLTAKELESLPIAT